MIVIATLILELPDVVVARVGNPGGRIRLKGDSALAVAAIVAAASREVSPEEAGSSAG